MRRRVLLLTAVLLTLLTVGLAGPAYGAAAWEEVRDRLVPMPPGFVETNEPGTVNGKLDLNMLLEAAGEDMPDGMSKEDLEEMNEAGFGRTMVNAELGDVLVIMGFKATEEEDAGYMVEGMLDSAKSDGEFTKDEVASTDDVHVYSMSSQEAKGQAAVIRKGKFAYMFLVAGAYAEQHKDLAKNLATQQLAALPAGSTDVGGDDTSGVVLALVVLGALIGGVVFVLVRRASKKAKEAEAARLAAAGETGIGGGEFASVGAPPAEPPAPAAPETPPTADE